MGPVASSLIGLVAWCAQGAGPVQAVQSVPPVPPVQPVQSVPQATPGPPRENPWEYPWEIVPEDALWGHLDAGDFREPVGLFYEPSAGELFVADSKNARIGIFDRQGTPLFSFGGAAVLVEPRVVLADQDGTIYVSDTGLSELRRFNYRGEGRGSLVFQMPSAQGGSPRPVSLAAVARERSGRWVVGDRTENRAFVFEADGRLVRELPPPIGKQAFQAISDIAVSAEGMVAISDPQGEPVIHVYDASGTMLYAFGKRDIGLDNFTSAAALAFDERGFLYAVDLLKHDVKVFTPAGRMVARFGGWFSPQTRGRAPGELLYPADIAVAPDGPIWVAERFGQRVQLFARRPLSKPRPAPAGETKGAPGR